MIGTERQFQNSDSWATPFWYSDWKKKKNKNDQWALTNLRIVTQWANTRCTVWCTNLCPVCPLCCEQPTLPEGDEDGGGRGDGLTAQHRGDRGWIVHQVLDPRRAAPGRVPHPVSFIVLLSFWGSQSVLWETVWNHQRCMTTPRGLWCSVGGQCERHKKEGMTAMCHICFSRGFCPGFVFCMKCASRCHVVSFGCCRTSRW